MLHVDPKLQKELITFLGDINITIKDITFIPLGEESYGWKIETDNQTIFLKYCTQKRILKNLSKINKLLLSLNNYGFIVPPVLLNGKTELPFKDGYIHAYPFIEGEVYTIFNDNFDKNLISELIKIMGDIHNVDINNLDIPKEDFNYNFRELYTQILIDLDNGMLVPEVSREDLNKLDNVISNFNKTSEYYRNNPPKLILTHGDITGRNILRSNNGEIKLIDWDEARISPKERDINFIYDNPNFNFEDYKNISNSDDYNPELREYYGNQWALESILVNITRLQHFKEEYGSREYLLEDVIECLGYY
jgi:thiamine kinase-like enzyme